MSIYKLKSSFQNLLRPVVHGVAARGITANQVTLAATVVSIGLGGLLAASGSPSMFWLVPGWMFVRMAFNAVDGMLAREHGQKSRLGGYLNEIGDVVSDAALYAPFALIAPFSAEWVGAVVFLSALTEFAGVLGAVHGNGRHYDGPMGKSDRAFVFGGLAIWVALSGDLPQWAWWILPVLCALMVWTTVNRVRNGLGVADS